MLPRIRYLRPVMLDVAAADFEAAVERFADVVEARVGSVLPRHRALCELRLELSDERKRPSVARTCRWQALAGIDPGRASNEWLQETEALLEETGDAAGEEILSILPQLEGVGAAERLVDAIKNRRTAVDQRGSRLAKGPVHGSCLGRPERVWRGSYGAQHHLGTGPLSDEKLSELL